MIAKAPQTDLTTGEMTNDIVLLDPKSPTGISMVGDRVDALATISLGGKSEDGSRPVINRDCKITLHDERGDCDAIRRTLEASEYKRITIALASNEPTAYLHQWFAKYTATRLDIFGDASSVTVIGKDGERNRYDRGEPEYLTYVGECKAIYDVYFILAEWDEDGNGLYRMDDGLGQYRLRTASRNSIRAFAAAVKMLGSFTRGQVAGVPIDVSAELRDVMTPDGKRQKLPIWQFRVRPPGGIRGGRELQARLSQCVQEAQLLQLPAPRVESPDQWEEGAFREIADDTDEPVSDQSAQALGEGGYCDFTFWNNAWHAAVRGTKLQQDDDRHLFIKVFTETRWPDDARRHTESLSDFLKRATEEDANALIAAADKVIAVVRAEGIRQNVKRFNDARDEDPTDRPSPDQGGGQTDAAAPDPLTAPANDRQKQWLRGRLANADPELREKVGDIAWETLKVSDLHAIKDVLDGKAP